MTLIWWRATKNSPLSQMLSKLAKVMIKKIDMPIFWHANIWHPTKQAIRFHLYVEKSICKKLKQLKPFLTKIRPTAPLTETPLVRSKGLTKEGRIDFVNIFHKNSNIFYTSNFLYPPLVPAYYFPLALLTFLCTCIQP